MDRAAIGRYGEAAVRDRCGDLARRAVASAVDPASPDVLNFTRDRQPLVDAAFLAQGMLRAPTALRDRLSATTKRQLIAALESTRAIVPGFNNWLLFSATVEAALKPLPVFGRVASAGPASIRPVLVQSGGAVDVGEGVVRPAVSDRSRYSLIAAVPGAGCQVPRVVS